MDNNRRSRAHSSYSRKVRDDYRDRRNDEQDYRYYEKRKSNKILIIFLSLLGLAIAGTGIYYVMKSNDVVEITSVKPNMLSYEEPYNTCNKVATTKYVKNTKDGTEGTVVGGATGAVAGGIIGNQIKQGGGGTLIGAVVGGVAGGLVGNNVQKSNQPDYIEKKGSTTKCHTAYKKKHVRKGYIVHYLYKNNIASVVMQTPPTIGSKLSFEQLKAMSDNGN